MLFALLVLPTVPAIAASRSVAASRAATATTATTSAPPAAGNSGGGALGDSSGAILLLFIAAAAVGGWAIYATAQKDASAETTAPATAASAEGTTTWLLRVGGADGAHDVSVELPAVLGRSSSADVCLLDPEVSGYHVRLASAGADRVEVTDLSSRNGTFFGDTRAESRVIASGESFRIGATEVTLVAAPADG